MNPKYPVFRFLAAVVLGIALLATASTVFAHEGDAKPRIYPPNSTPFGMTYGDWAAAYLQYQFSLPVSGNPSFAGGDCNVGQRSGPVFFAPVSFGAPLTLSCTIPASKAIFIVVIAAECSTLEPPPFHGSNPQELRECAGAGADGVGLNTLKVTIDHSRISHLERFRAQSPYYDFVMPAEDNILGQAGVTSGSAVVDGYFLMLKPLSPGTHVVHFEGTFVSGPSAGFSASTTLNLTVE